MDQAAQVIGFFSWSYSMEIENYPCIDPIRRLIISFKFLTISVEITFLLKIYFLTKFKRYEIYLIWEKSKGNFSKRFSSFVFFRENNFFEFKLILIIMLLLKLLPRTKESRIILFSNLISSFS